MVMKLELSKEQTAEIQALLVLLSQMDTDQEVKEKAWKAYELISSKWGES